MSASVPGWRAASTAEVREITFSEPIFARRVRISSWIAAAKYAASPSALRSLNGSTAIDGSATGDALVLGAREVMPMYSAIATTAASATAANANRATRLRGSRDGESGAVAGSTAPMPAFSR